MTDDLGDEVDAKPRPPKLTKVTYNLTADAIEARDVLTVGWRMTQTDAVNRALRVAARVRELAPEGHLRVIRPDGTRADIYFV